MSLNMNAIRPLVERYKTATAGWQMQLALAVAEQSPALLAKVDELTAALGRRDQDIRDRYEQIARLERHIAGLETQCNEQMHALADRLTTRGGTR